MRSTLISSTGVCQNGIEVTRQIRSLGDDTPIIILTAYDWSDIEAEARAAGVTAFCAKPLFMSDIRDTLMTAIGQSQAEVEDSIISEANVYCLWKIMN